MPGRVIDTTRTITFEKDVYGDCPEAVAHGATGWYIVEFDPVMELNEGNGYTIWPCGPFKSADAAREVYLADRAEAVSS